MTRGPLTFKQSDVVRDKFPSEEADRFQVRMPSGLREQIRIAAERNGRSMNTEIVTILTAALMPEDGGLAAVERKLTEALAAVRLAQKDGDK